MKIHPIGTDALIEDDRPALLAAPAAGRPVNSIGPQVWLDYFDPTAELHVALGWFSADDLQKIVDAARGEEARR